MDKINALPEAENLDEEISTQTTLISEQDDKIAELADILSSKTSGSNSPSIETTSVIIRNTTSYPIYYVTGTTLNEDGMLTAYYNYNYTNQTTEFSFDTVINAPICIFFETDFNRASVANQNVTQYYNSGKMTCISIDTKQSFDYIILIEKEEANGGSEK
jgi:hypothetical protein